jgi:hypothetical protein
MFKTHSQKIAALILIFTILFAVTFFFLKDQGIILRKTVPRSAVQPPDYTETPINAQWRKYHRKEWDYEFEIPTEWITSPNTSPSIHREIYLPVEGKPSYVIRVHAVPPIKLPYLPPFHCSQNPKDTTRCEKRQVSGQEMIIDWGNATYPNSQKTIVRIPHKYGGFVIFELSPVTEESKAQLDLILSTFHLY